MPFYQPNYSQPHTTLDFTSSDTKRLNPTELGCGGVGDTVWLLGDNRLSSTNLGYVVRKKRGTKPDVVSAYAMVWDESDVSTARDASTRLPNK